MIEWLRAGIVTMQTHNWDCYEVLNETVICDQEKESILKMFRSRAVAALLATLLVGVISWLHLPHYCYLL